MFKFLYTPTYTYVEEDLPVELVEEVLTFSSEYITFWDDARKMKTSYPIRKKVTWKFYEWDRHDGLRWKFPSGFLPRVIKALGEENIEIELKVDKPRKEYDFQTSLSSWLKENDKELRYFQDEAADLIQDYDSGVLEVGTGGGKTLIYANIIAKLGVKALFITVDLQSKNDTYLDEKDGGGFVNFFGTENVSTIDRKGYEAYPIVVANIQNCWAKYKKRDRTFMNYLQTVDLLIFNECHHINESNVKTSLSNTWYKMAMEIPAWYRVGATGTAGEDGTLKRELLRGAIGETIYKKDTRALIQEGYACEIEAHVYKMPFFNTEHVKYVKAFETLITNQDFLKNIVLLARHYSKGSKKVVLFCEWREKQAIVLNDMLGKDSGVIHGLMKKDERDEVLKDFIDGKFSILVTTVLNEDFNLPALDAGIVIGKQASEVTLKQRIGRMARVFEGKKKGYLVFIQPEDKKQTTDRNGKIKYVPGIISRQSIKAIDIIRKEGHTILFKDLADLYL